MKTQNLGNPVVQFLEGIIVFDPSQLITKPRTRVRLMLQEECIIPIIHMISAVENAARSIPVNCFRFPQRYRPTIADIPAKIEAGVVLPAPDQDFPIIAYYLDGSPVSQERFMPTALAPFSLF
ncbi:hypothetical protein RHSIM_RhsimMtG0006000 (mitochondrion) [Rhododendron simsii]|uniref:Uncharacterized protein n=1 Tax=Rhododendron simsii TaxID=118357 RepID=A0A834L5C9_RHOSS|nr:hypothetical protein RHSIM_RhsimMtG0006000 [Rhododendron simsii]